MEFTEALHCIAAEIGIGSPVPDNDGIVQLDYDGRLALTMFIVGSPPVMCLSASLSELPAEAGVSLFRELLKKNFLLLDTRGGALSIDDEAGQVHFCQHVSMEAIVPDQLLKAFASFIETGLTLQDELRDWDHEQGKAAAESSRSLYEQRI
jgi:hypothetical protein